VVDEVTPVTVGDAVSILKFLLAPSDPEAPGAGNCVFKLLPAESLMNAVPSDKAVVLT
jgi:hypothetical protein